MNESGEPVVVLAGDDMARLVAAAAKLASAGVGRYAIIGGVAVSVRLGQAHRATADLDAVVDDATPPPAIEALLEMPGAVPDPTGAHRVLVDGIKVEFQGTEPIDPADLEGLTDRQLLYVGAHRHALESATVVTLAAATGEVRASVPVATPGALIAMKLHSIEDRRAVGGLDKRAGDAWDIYRILLDLDGASDLRDELSALHPVLREVVLDSIRRRLVDDAPRTASWMKAGDESMASVSAAELRMLGQPVVDTLIASR